MSARRSRAPAIENACNSNLTGRPVFVWSRETLEAGFLLSYGPDFVAIARRIGTYVDKILKGAKPADLPVEQPTRFQLLLNDKTANALRISFPPHLLATADEVIE